jgi:hypothetical protein
MLGASFNRFAIEPATVAIHQDGSPSLKNGLLDKSPAMKSQALSLP